MNLHKFWELLLGVKKKTVEKTGEKYMPEERILNSGEKNRRSHFNQQELLE